MKQINSEEGYNGKFLGLPDQQSLSTMRLGMKFIHSFDRCLLSTSYVLDTGNTVIDKDTISTFKELTVFICHLKNQLFFSHLEFLCS